METSESDARKKFDRLKIALGAYALSCAGWACFTILYGWGDDYQAAAFLGVVFGLFVVEITVMLGRRGRVAWLLAVVVFSLTLLFHSLSIVAERDLVPVVAALADIVVLSSLWLARGYCGVGRWAVPEYPDDSPPFAWRKLVFWLFIVLIGLLCLGAVFGLLFASGPSVGRKSMLLAVLICVSLLIALAAKNFMGWFLGVKGEQKVATVLGLYWPEWKYVLNLELSNRGDIDAVVVGPTGVWAIEVKNVVGEMVCTEDILLKDGAPFGRDPLKQAYAAAKMLEKRLFEEGVVVPVRAAVVFSADYAKVRMGMGRCLGVYVIGYRWLGKLLNSSDFVRVLDSNRVEGIYEKITAWK